MATPRNGCKTSKSLSRVMMALAKTAKANSKNMLSLGSRLAVIGMEGLMCKQVSLYSWMNNCLSAKDAYWSNLGCNNFSCSSFNVWVDRYNWSKSSALSTHLRAAPVGNNAAARTTLVSSTKRFMTSGYPASNSFSFCSVRPFSAAALPIRSITSFNASLASIITAKRCNQASHSAGVSPFTLSANGCGSASVICSKLGMRPVFDASSNITTN